MTAVLRDVVHSLRLLRRSPGFAALAVLTLAVGIGASTAVFGLIDALLLRTLDAPAADRLMVPELTLVNAGKSRPITVWSYPKYETFLASQDVFEDVAGFRDLDFNLATDAASVRVTGEMVTPSYLAILGVTPVAGRRFATEDSDVAILGWHLWQERYGGDPAVVGRTVRLKGKTLTIVGVAPRGFRGLTGNAELWVPFALAPTLMHPKMLTMRWSHWFETVARVKPGIAPAQLAARMAQLGAIIAAAHPASSTSQVWGARAISLAEARKDPKMRTSVLVLFGGVALVLLIGCVNVANLLLSRASRRRHEIAVRASLGATRGRLIRQLLTESLVLGVLAGGLGLVLALWGIDVLTTLRPGALDGTGISSAELNELQAMGFSPAVAAFAIGISLLASALFGVVPALSTTRVNLAQRLKESGTSVTSRRRARGALAALEVALALVLLAGAGVLLRSMARVAAADLGFRADHVLAFRIEPVRGQPHGDVWERREELGERLAALPGVTAVGFDECAPPLGQCDETEVDEIAGKPRFADGTAPGVGVHFVNPDHFRALGVPLRHGRLLDTRDRVGAPQVIVLNEAAARALFPGEEAIGQRLHAAYGAEGLAEVVGVVGDVRYDGPMEPARPQIYVPAQQFGPAAGFVFLRTDGDPTALAAPARAAVQAFDAELPIFGVQPLAERARDATARLRFAALLLAGFAGVALLLAALGVYGVMAAMVAERRREIGIRMALGARGGAVLAMVVRHGAALAFVGVVAGLGLSLALARVLAGMVFGVSPTDPATYALVAAAVLAIAVLSCALAARRALQVNPLEALRAE